MFHRYIYICLYAASAALAQESFSLYAYNRNMTGFPLVFADGLAYISNGTVDTVNATTATNVTFAFTGSSGRTLSASPNTTTNPNATWEGSKYFFVLPEEDASQAGFVDNTENAPSGAASDGFLLYGQQLMLLDDGNLLAQFWATALQPGLWKLVWNGSGVKHSQSIPVVLKPTPPTTTDSSNK